MKNLKITDGEINNIKEIFSGINESPLEEYSNYKKLINDFKIALEQECRLTGAVKSKIIFIDELDRCRPNFAIEVLETVKHIFDVKGVIFIFLVNKNQLIESVKQQFGAINQNEEYFDKFFNLNFSLPRLNFNEYNSIDYPEFMDNSFYLLQTNNNQVMVDLNNFNTRLFFELASYFKGMTPRKQKQLLRKYKILLKTLNNIEKRSVPLNILLIDFLIYKEVSQTENYIFLNSLKKYPSDVQLRTNGHRVTPIPLDFNNLKDFIASLISHMNSGVPSNVYPMMCNNNENYYICEECKKSCPTYGVGGVLYKNKRVFNLLEGLFINYDEFEPNPNRTKSLLLPLPSTYFSEGKTFMTWIEEKYNFISNLK